MRSSAALTILVIAASVPAFSAPLTSNDVFSRDAPISQVDAQDESGALGIGKIISGLAGLFFNKREDIDLLTRHDDFLQREYTELFSRDTPSTQQVDPESGALNIPGIINTVGGFLDALFGKREDLELFARSLANEDILKRGNDINPTLFAREYDNLLTRADPSASTDESGALNIPGIINGLGGLFDAFFGKREELELLTRSLGADEEFFKRQFVDLLSRSDQSTDESGALNIPKIVTTIGGLFDTFFGSKREEFEILARDYALQMREFEARGLNELD